MTSRGRTERVGGHLVAEALGALGARTALGVPGQHALGIFDGLAIHDRVRFVGLRTEVGASFAAHGFATVADVPGVLLVSTGPGALMSLAGIQEARTTGTPLIVIASEIPSEGSGRGRGFVHELDDQIAHFAPLVKGAFHVRTPETIPDVLAEAWRIAVSPPSGPVFVEIPVDVLAAETDLPTVDVLDGAAAPRPARPEVLDAAARRLEAAERVTILAGGGVLRAGAWDALRDLAERLDAPVVLTYGGKGALAADHPLYAGSACEDPDVMEAVGGADVALVVGASLSEETTNHYSLRFRGDLLHVDADAARIGTTYRATPIVADARLALEGLLARVSSPRPRADGGAQRAARLRDRVERRLAAQGRELERGMLATVAAAMPPGAITSWDMTIMAYWAALALPVPAPRTFLYPQGSGTLGYGFPAAIGAKAARPDRPVLAIAGDGGIMYGLPELVAARQAGLDVKLLVIDDGGYGVLREYQRAAYDRTFATDLVRPEFAGLFRAAGFPSSTVEVDGLAGGLEELLAADGPGALVLKAQPEMFLPTHL